MRQFSINVDIDATPERVWEVMSDVERWHEWTPSVTSIRRKESWPLAVGSSAVVRQPKFPPALWRVTAIKPGRAFTWVNSFPGLIVIAHHSVASTGAASRATLSVEFRGLLGGVLATMTKRITERYLALEAKGLKGRSENPAFTHLQGTRDHVNTDVFRG